MAAVTCGKVVIFGAGGPVAAAAIQALKGNYTLRLTDIAPMEEIAVRESPQGPRAPVPELLGPPHENMVVDVSDYSQVEAACRGADAAINLSVVRGQTEKAFSVNVTGAYNVSRAAVACGLKRVIHTGPFHVSLGHKADYWHDHQVVDDVPLHPGGDLYALTKYIGGHMCRVFAEREGQDTLVFLFCGFRPRNVEPGERGRGMSPFTVSWEDAGESFLYGLRAPAIPSPYETFFICCDSPGRKHRVDKARRLLGWEAKDRFEELYTRGAEG